MKIQTRESWRKSVHLSGVFLIPLILWNRNLSAAVLSLCLFVYLAVEILDRRGSRLPFLTALTERCKRTFESGRLSRGALFLVLSGVTTPYLFGSHAAAIGLGQAFVADVTSTLAGIRWGRLRLPYSKTKSWVGSAVFFATAFAVSLVFVSWPQALALAAIGAVVESLPIPEADNLTVPLVVGLAARLLGTVPK